MELPSISTSPRRPKLPLVVTLLACFVTAASLGCGGTGAPEAANVGTGSLFAAGGLGDECVVGDDCESGFCDRTVPGGYCTQPCETSEQCGVAGHCAFGFCFQTCRSQRECRSSEFECFAAAPEIGVCSFLVDAARPDAPNIGAPCRASVECSAPGEMERYCISERDLDGRSTGYPGGMCVALDCAHDLDCGEGSRCLAGAMPYCAPACAAATECRPGYVCDSTSAACVPGS